MSELTTTRVRPRLDLPVGRYAMAIQDAQEEVGAPPQDLHALDKLQEANRWLGEALEAMLAKRPDEARRALVGAGLWLAHLHEAIAGQVAVATQNGADPEASE